MTKKGSVFDVFLSVPRSAKVLGDRVATSLSAAELSVFWTSNTAGPSQLSDGMRFAMAESLAVVMIVNEDAIASASMMFELGAAFGWNKAVFTVIDNISADRLPAMLRNRPVFLSTDVESLVRAVKGMTTPMGSDGERVLIALYSEVNTSLDEMMRKRILAEQFVRRFNSRRKTSLSGEQVLREMLRLRKLGRLPRKGSRRK